MVQLPSHCHPCCISTLRSTNTIAIDNGRENFLAFAFDAKNITQWQRQSTNNHRTPTLSIRNIDDEFGVNSQFIQTRRCAHGTGEPKCLENYHSTRRSLRFDSQAAHPCWKTTLATHSGKPTVSSSRCSAHAASKRSLSRASTRRCSFLTKRTT